MVTNAPLMFQKLYHFEWYGGSLRAWITGLGLPYGAEVLEVGCGSGALTGDMLDMGYKVSAIDASGRMLKRARQRIEEREGLTFTQADALDLPFENGSFDATVAASLLNAVSDRQALLAEMFRVTKAGGIVSVFSPSRNFTPANADAFARLNGLAANQRAALEVWASAARKLSEEEVVLMFESAGFVDVKPARYLDQMLLSVTGTHPV